MDKNCFDKNGIDYIQIQRLFVKLGPHIFVFNHMHFYYFFKMSFPISQKKHRHPLVTGERAIV